MPVSARVWPRSSRRQAQGLEQLGSREHRLDVVPGREDRERLVDHVVLVGLEVLHPALLDQLDHPARVEVDAEADAATVLAQVLYGQAQPARARGAEHQPVGARREVLVRQVGAEQFVVGAEVVQGHPALRDARGAAGLEHVDRIVGHRLRHPAPHRAAAQPLVLERRELAQVGETGDVAARVEVELRGEVQPEGRAGLRVKVPLHHVADVGVELLPGLCLSVSAGDFHLRTPIESVQGVGGNSVAVPLAAADYSNGRLQPRRPEFGGYSGSAKTQSTPPCGT